MELREAVAIVTGSSSGVGAATARMLAEKGARVLINCAHDVEGGERVAAECKALGAEAALCQADVSIDADCRRLAETALRLWGRIDILVNSAGTTKSVSHYNLEGLSSDDFIRIFSVNTLGPFQTARAVAPHMKARGQGAIVNVSSTAGLRGTGSSIAYGVSKAALNTLTQSLARVLAPEIRVNAVCPGFIQGRWVKNALGDAYEEHKAHWETSSPLRKAATPEEVAATILWLVESAALITGQTIVADAGMTLGPAGSGVMGKRR
ncbi:MAG: SDR family NAD(P)-dependent oxidoreductase [Alphaproteobacteria bacterium]